MKKIIIISFMCCLVSLISKAQINTQQKIKTVTKPILELREYSIKVTLKKIKILTTYPANTQERPNGEFYVTDFINLNTNKKLDSFPKNLWRKIADDVSKQSSGYTAGGVINVNSSFELGKLSDSDIKNLVFSVGGIVKSLDVILIGVNNADYICNTCTTPQNYPTQRRFLMNDNINRINLIENLMPNNTYTDLPVGDDNLLEMNFQEGGGLGLGGPSKIQALFTISVKRTK